MVTTSEGLKAEITRLISAGEQEGARKKLDEALGSEDPEMQKEALSLMDLVYPEPIPIPSVDMIDHLIVVGNYGQAITDLRRAIEARPDDEDYIQLLKKVWKNSRGHTQQVKEIILMRRGLEGQLSGTLSALLSELEGAPEGGAGTGETADGASGAEGTATGGGVGTATTESSAGGGSVEEILVAGRQAMMEGHWERALAFLRQIPVTDVRYNSAQDQMQTCLESNLLAKLPRSVTEILVRLPSLWQRAQANLGLLANLIQACVDCRKIVDDFNTANSTHHQYPSRVTFIHEEAVLLQDHLDNYDVGRQYLREGKFDQAVRAFGQALTPPPGYEPAGEAKTRAAVHQASVTKAKQVAGSFRPATGDLISSMEDLEKVLSDSPDSNEISSLMQQVRRRAGEVALGKVRKAGEYISGLDQVSTLAGKRQRLALAVKELEDATSLDGEDQEAADSLARARNSLRQHEDADEALQQQIEDNLAQGAAWRPDMFDTAAAAIQSAAAIAPQDIRITRLRQRLRFLCVKQADTELKATPFKKSNEDTALVWHRRARDLSEDTGDEELVRLSSRIRRKKISQAMRKILPAVAGVLVILVAYVAVAPVRSIIVDAWGTAFPPPKPPPAVIAPVQPLPWLDCTYKTETGHNVCDEGPQEFRKAWLSYGGILGNPVTEKRSERGFVVQYFERGRLEYHPNEPKKMHLGNVGGELLTEAVIKDDPATRDASTRLPGSYAERGVYFVETGHYVSLEHGFKSFFDEKGGIDVLGYPVTERYDSAGVLTQWFQRARFELRGGRIELGNIGVEYLYRVRNEIPALAEPPKR